MPQALDALRLAARCLYLRQLLSDAAKRELTAQAPAVSGFLSGEIWLVCVTILCFKYMPSLPSAGTQPLVDTQGAH